MQERLYRRHTTKHWFWVAVGGGEASTVHIVDDFGNLVQMRAGLYMGILRD